MRTNGYIHLHRSILAWNYHNNPVMFTVWAHLIMLAEYEDREQDGITIHRGELLVSQQWLAEYIGISEKQLRLCLQKLEEGKEITKKRACGKTLVSILKYNDYQVLTSSRPVEKANETPTFLPVKGQQKGDKERNIKNNKKNLSDGEIQKSDISVSKATDKPEPPERPIPPRSNTIQNPSPCGEAGGGRQFFQQLVAHEGWKQKCCRDYNIAPDQMPRHIVAFHEHLLRNASNKSWLSFNDFCLHFHSWLRFQTPESIKRLATQAVQRSREQKARQIEQQRQQQMWKEIEETKRKAVSYEEYKRLTSSASG